MVSLRTMTWIVGLRLPRFFIFNFQEVLLTIHRQIFLDLIGATVAKLLNAPLI